MKRLFITLSIVVCFIAFASAAQTPEQTFRNFKQALLKDDYAAVISLVDSNTITYINDVIKIQALGEIEMPDEEYLLLMDCISIDNEKLVSVLIDAFNSETQFISFLPFVNVTDKEINGTKAVVTITGGYDLIMVQENGDWKISILELVDEYLNININNSPRLVFYHYTRALAQSDYSAILPLLTPDYIESPETYAGGKLNLMLDSLPDTLSPGVRKQAIKDRFISAVSEYSSAYYSNTDFTVTDVKAEDNAVIYTFGNNHFYVTKVEGQWYIAPQTFE